MLAKIAQLETVWAARTRAPVFKLRAGALSCYHGSRFPTTLYTSQWKNLLVYKNEILEFIAANGAAWVGNNPRERIAPCLSSFP